jgi:hypothetical protein
MPVLTRTSHRTRATQHSLHHYRLLIFTAYLSPAKTRCRHKTMDRRSKVPRIISSAARPPMIVVAFLTTRNKTIFVCP